MDQVVLRRIHEETYNYSQWANTDWGCGQAQRQLVSMWVGRRGLPHKQRGDQTGKDHGFLSGGKDSRTGPWRKGRTDQPILLQQSGGEEGI